MDLLHGAMQFMQDALMVCLTEFNQINSIADEQADVVQRIIKFMGNAGGKLSERCQFTGLDKLFLLLAQLLLAALYLCCRLTQVAHDVYHGFATIFQAQIGLVRILEDMTEGTAGIMQSLSLPGETATVLLVVGQDVDHRLALIG